MIRKTWFITGCSKGFGRLIAEELLHNSEDNIVATARDPSSLADLQAKYADRLLALKLDVTYEDEIKASVQQAIKRFGKIDVLINNAGYGLGGVIEECSMEDIKSQFETNVFGLIAVTKAVIPHMRENKSGYIINLSSIAGLVASAGAGIYNSTKFAVEGISEALSMELAEFNIKVVIVEPGPFRTDFLGDSIRISKQMDEYNQNEAVSRRRNYYAHRHQQQAGDPAKAAKIIISLGNMENPPTRLILGNSSVDIARDKFTSLLKSIDENESLSRSADYDEFIKQN